MAGHAGSKSAAGHAGSKIAAAHRDIWQCLFYP